MHCVDSTVLTAFLHYKINKNVPINHVVAFYRTSVSCRPSWAWLTQDKVGYFLYASLWVWLHVLLFMS